MDPHNAENLAAGAKLVARLLDGEDPWVQLNAAGALATFGRRAQPLLPRLRAKLDTDDPRLKTRLGETIEAIEQAPAADPAATAAYDARRKAIRQFCQSHQP